MKNTFAAIKYWMDKILSIACAILLSFITILVLIQVFSRYVLNSPVAFTEELVRYSLIWTGFIGAAYAFSTREHMSLTLVRDKFTADPAPLVYRRTPVATLSELQWPRSDAGGRRPGRRAVLGNHRASLRQNRSMHREGPALLYQPRRLMLALQSRSLIANICAQETSHA